MNLGLEEEEEEGMRAPNAGCADISGNGRKSVRKEWAEAEREPEAAPGQVETTPALRRCGHRLPNRTRRPAPYRSGKGFSGGGAHWVPPACRGLVTPNDPPITPLSVPRITPLNAPQ